MPTLYNCKHSGDQYRISKFDSDFNLETSYLCDETACECPAGHRPTCRHRQMLPKFIAREAVGTEWFFDHDRGGWVQGWKEPSQILEEQLVASAALPLQQDEPSPYETFTIANYVEIPEGATSEQIAEAFGNLLAAQPLLDQPQPELTGLQEEQILMGFHQPELCKDLQPSPPSPSPTIRRRV